LALFRNSLLLLIALACSASAWAGGGPEGVLLVVNPLSPSSLTIANHYARLRAIPADNLLYLPWPVNVPTTDVDTFRQRILLPILANLRQRKVTDQIDTILYSSDFPWGVTLNKDVSKFVEEARRSRPADGPDKSDAQTAALAWPKHLTPVGSLNGLTYLWQAVGPGFATYFEVQSNHYMQLPTAGDEGVASAGFRATREYSAQGAAVASGGRRYLLSMMLAVTAGRGNSVDEAVAYLARSAAADGTHPKGTIYFVKNSNIRSRVRDGLFPAVVAELTRLGVAAEIIEGTLPLNRKDVQGVVMGTAVFDWKASNSTILPGALCDNFTSFGGIMTAGAGQAPLSEFLRYGAAGATGTVTEPYAIAAKFPSPWVQTHYARGCTLAEALYQSVHAPYQLLMVGDPLCRPWADVPEVSVGGVESSQSVRGLLKLHPTATLPLGKMVQGFELFVDAQRVAECPTGGTLTLDTAKVADGYHELRVVARGPAPIETQGRQVVPLRFDNHDRRIEASLVVPGPYRADASVRIAVRSPGTVGIVAIQGSRIVGKVAAEQGEIAIPAKMLGAGPVSLRLAGLGDGGPVSNVMAAPLEFVVEAAASPTP
jgi:uncharacterized protein (TIGR03790 family)